MKILMLEDADFRVKPAVIQAFRAGRSYSVPRKTALALIARKAAIAQPRSSQKETTDV